MNVQQILSEPTWKHICFAEQDATDAGAPPDPEADAVAALLNEGEEDNSNDNEPEEFEVEVGSKKFKLKADDYGKSAKDAWDNMNRAHTERSEKAAAREREFEQRGKDLEERQKIVQDFPREVAKVVGLKEQMEAYQKVDWVRLRASGKMVQLDNGTEIPEADYHYGQYQNLQAQLQTASEDLQNKIGTERQKRDAAFAQQKANFHAEMSQKVKDWSPQKDAEIRDFAVKHFGVPKEIVENVYHPGLMQIALTAHSYVKAMDRAKAAANKKQEGEEPLTPPAKIKSNGTRKPTLESAKSVEEYQKIRLEQMAQSRASRLGGLRR